MSENTLINQLPDSLPEGLALKGLVVSPMSKSGPDLQGVLKTQNGEFPVVIEDKIQGEQPLLGRPPAKSKNMRFKEELYHL